MIRDFVYSAVGVFLALVAVCWMVLWSIVGLVFLVLFVWIFQGDTTVAWETYKDLLCAPVNWISRTFYEGRVHDP